MVTLMAPGDQAVLSPFNMEYMQLCRSSLTLPPKCIVLSVGQDFFNGSPTAVLRIATSNVLDMTGSSNPVLCLSPITARECQLVDEWGCGFVSPIDAMAMESAPVAGSCSSARAGVSGMGGGASLAAGAVRFLRSRWLRRFKMMVGVGVPMVKAWPPSASNKIFLRIHFISIIRTLEWRTCTPRSERNWKQWHC